ncbi:MAG: hypothetical protein U0935_18990 [Pirellulales bacterium]
MIRRKFLAYVTAPPYPNSARGTAAPLSSLATDMACLSRQLDDLVLSGEHRCALPAPDVGVVCRSAWPIMPLCGQRASGGILLLSACCF